MTQFRADPEFVGNAASFLQDGLCKSGSALLIASPASVDAVRQRLSKWLLAQPERMLAIDAIALLRHLTEDGVPDELDFQETMDSIIRQITPAAGASIYVASEIIELARAMSNTASAAVVVGLWNDLPRRHKRCEFMLDFSETLKLR
jgi:hypothetical protein